MTNPQQAQGVLLGQDCILTMPRIFSEIFTEGAIFFQASNAASIVGSLSALIALFLYFHNFHSVHCHLKR